ncbi:MAG: hypothetical protein JL50_04045 [Peptococcaceae bacterium BICA1-7]|nr:MAG: hypothetical protein JL50_04045 [Peptococcaceae bacterium BICA1-7]HBV97563.1 helix-turn-helix domain-containing protein [Desulfotomaculum sp.]
MEAARKIDEFKELMTAREMAEYLRIGVRKAYELCNQKGFPVVRLGMSYRIPKKALDIWLQRQAGVF